MIDEIFELASDDGMTRRGILSMPERRLPAAVLVLLQAGVKYRVGPSRLYVDIARSLAESGFATLRFDPIGVGESDGTMESGHLHDLWRTIECGRFVADTVLVVESVRERLGEAKVFLGGLCGGGLTLQLAAAALSERPPAGLISINTAVAYSRGRNQPPAPGHIEARANLSAYSRKVLSADAWRRVVSGASDYRSIAATLSALFSGSTDPSAHGVNPLFLSAFREVHLRGVPHLMIFSENDSRWFQFQEFVLGSELGGAREGPTHSVRLIPQANHDLHWKEWRATACGWITEWMQRG